MRSRAPSPLPLDAGDIARLVGDEPSLGVVEDDQMVVPGIGDHGAAPDGDLEGLGYDTTSGGDELLDGGRHVMDCEVGLGSRPFGLHHELCLRFGQAKPGTRRASPDQLVAEVAVELDRPVQIGNAHRQAVDLPKERIVAHGRTLRRKAELGHALVRDSPLDAARMTSLRPASAPPAVGYEHRRPESCTRSRRSEGGLAGVGGVVPGRVGTISAEPGEGRGKLVERLGLCPAGLVVPPDEVADRSHLCEWDGPGRRRDRKPDAFHGLGDRGGVTSG